MHKVDLISKKPIKAIACVVIDVLVPVSLVVPVSLPMPVLLLVPV